MQANSNYPYFAAMKNLPPSTILYQALLKRDSTFEGIFYVGVKTTGIFCRPTCPAKKPKPENVEYFSNQQQALYAGYRPCARCHPMEKNKQTPALVKQLCKMVEQSAGEKISEADLRKLAIDPSTARRQFQKHYGMTFHAYQRARRMGVALHEVRNGKSVIGAQLNNGYESSSGFWKAFRKVFGETPSHAERLNCLFAKWIETPLGAMLAIANEEGLHLLEFVDRRGLENEIRLIRKKTNCPILPGNNGHLEQINQELGHYFNGDNLKFDLSLVLHGTPFEQKVWQQLLKIPPGKTVSYAEIAQAMNNPKAVRAVGRANGKNCLAIILPCHRVIGADGKLTGYGGGLWRKKWLLEHERRAAVR